MAVCDLYSHNHASVIIEAHHVVPKSWFVGVAVDTPMARLCPNCHMNVHAAIDATLARGGSTDGIPPRCKQLALEALRLAEEKGLTPKPTL